MCGRPGGLSVTLLTGLPEPGPSGGLVRAGGDGRASGSLGGGLVLLRNAGGDAAAGADRDALVFARARMPPAALTA